MDVSFLRCEIPGELFAGLWRLDANFSSLSLDWTLVQLKEFLTQREGALQRLVVEKLEFGEANNLQDMTSVRDFSEGDASRLDECCRKHRLNTSQWRGLLQASTNRLSLIQGPPGTGKTQTILAFLDCFGQPTDPAVCLGSGNMCVDNLCRRCLQLGLNVVRTGKIDKDTYDQTLKNFCLESMAEAEMGANTGSAAESARREWERDYIRSEAQVVCSTCTTLCATYMSGVAYKAMVISTRRGMPRNQKLLRRSAA